jgi:hypothetical protein
LLNDALVDKFAELTEQGQSVVVIDKRCASKPTQKQWAYESPDLASPKVQEIKTGDVLPAVCIEEGAPGEKDRENRVFTQWVKTGADSTNEAGYVYYGLTHGPSYGNLQECSYP